MLHFYSISCVHDSQPNSTSIQWVVSFPSGFKWRFPSSSSSSTSKGQLHIHLQSQQDQRPGIHRTWAEANVNKPPVTRVWALPRIPWPPPICPGGMTNSSTSRRSTFRLAGEDVTAPEQHSQTHPPAPYKSLGNIRNICFRTLEGRPTRDWLAQTVLTNSDTRGSYVEHAPPSAAAVVDGKFAAEDAHRRRPIASVMVRPA